ncbi:MAG: hypothetical protein R3C14_16070 [Caldilineaceae bacterium]
MSTAKQISKQRYRLIGWLFYGGIGGIAFGGIHLWSFYTLGDRIAFYDAMFNILLGVSYFASFRLVEKGKFLAVQVCAVSLVAALLYGWIMGRGFNVIMLVIGGVLLWQVIQLWRRGELA